MATITSLSFAITSTYSGAGLRRARRDLDDFDNGLTGMNKAASNIAGQLGSVTNAALLLGPALVPIGVAAGGVAGGLVASTAAAGAAAGIFGGALFGAITKTVEATKAAKDGLKKQELALSTLTPGTKAYSEQLKKVHEAETTLTETLKMLSPAQRRFYDSMGDMTTGWARFIAATEKDTLTPTSIAMDAVSRNMGKFIPIIKAVSPLVTGVAQDFADWMDGKGLDRFVNTIKTQGVPALGSFIKIGRDVIGVLGKGFRDFLPFGNEVVANIAEGADKLKGWADGGGFQRFLDKVHDVAPDVKEFLLTLIESLKNIGQAAAELSGNSFSVFMVFLQVLSSLPPELLANLVRAWLAWNAALIVYNVVAGIAAAVTAILSIAASGMGIILLGMALTIGLVVIALVALAVGIYFLVKYWDQVSGFLVKVWDATWNWIKQTALTVWDFLTHGWGQFLLLLMGPLGLAVLVWKHWDEIWGWIRDSALTVWAALKSGWADFTGWLSSTWNSIWGGLLDAWHAFSDPFIQSWNQVWPELKLVIDQVWGDIKEAWALLWSGVTIAWSAFWGTFGPSIKASWQGLVDSVKAYWDVLTAAWNLVWTVIKSTFDVAWAVLSGAWSIAWSLLTSTAKVAWAVLTGAWSVVWAVVTGTWNVFYATFAAIFSGAWKIIVATVTGIWDVIKAAWDALWKVVTALFLTFAAIFTGHWGKAWTAIQAAGQAIWNLINTAWQAFLNVIKSVFLAFSGVLTAAWSAFWAAVQAVAAAAWSAFRGVFQAFLDGIKSVWNAAWNAIRNLFQVFVSAVTAVATATWNAIRVGVQAFLTAVHAIWNTAWTTIRTLFQSAATSIANAATVLWTAMRTTFSVGSTWLRETFWNPVNNFFTKTIPAAFTAGVSAIGKAWDKLKAIVRAPIEAIVNVVYNNGIRKLWNIVAGAFGAKELGAFTLPAFKDGGPTGAGSADGFLAKLHPNEHVWTAAEVKGAGGHKAVADLRSQAMGGARVRTFGGSSFEDGGGFLGTGIGPSLGDIGSAVSGVVGKLKDLALGAISGPFSAAVDSVVKVGKAAVRTAVPGDGNALESMGVGMVDKIATAVKSWVKTNDVAPDVAGGSVADALTWAKAQAGKPYLWGGVGPGGYDCSGFMGDIQNVIMGNKTYRRIWATGAFNGGSAPAGWKYHEKAPFTVGITNAGVGHTAGTLNGVNVESRGGAGVVIGSKARGYNNSLFNSWYGFMPSKSAGGAGGTVGAAQATAKAMLSKYGWNSGQWPALQKLWAGESGWRWNAKNPSSGAYGIPQALPASKMASAGSDWKTNATTQIKWGEGYIKSVYGSPSSALSKWQARSPHWYGLGTPGAHSGPAWVGETQPELVNFRGGERVDPLSKLVGKGSGGGDHIEISIPISGNVDHGVVDRLERDTIPKLRMALQQGVGRRP